MRYASQYNATFSTTDSASLVQVSVYCTHYKLFLMRLTSHEASKEITPTYLLHVVILGDTWPSSNRRICQTSVHLSGKEKKFLLNDYGLQPLRESLSIHIPFRMRTANWNSISDSNTLRQFSQLIYSPNILVRDVMPATAEHIRHHSLHPCDTNLFVAASLISGPISNYTVLATFLITILLTTIVAGKIRVAMDYAFRIAYIFSTVSPDGVIHIETMFSEP